MTIIPYHIDYNNKINEFICSILVEEFEYQHHKDEILMEDNNKFVNNGGNFWIAIDEQDNIIGTICLSKQEGNNGELKKLYVNSEYRSKGLAHLLYDEMLLFAKQNNITSIRLSTYIKLEAAIKFYLKKGFKETHRENDAVYFVLDVALN